MRNFVGRRRPIVVVSVIGLLFVAALAFFSKDRRAPAVSEYAAIREDWDQAVLGPDRPTTGREKEAQWRRLSERCLTLAEEHPNTAVELAALVLAAGKDSASPQGTRACELLRTRIATADLGHLAMAIGGLGLGPSPTVPDIAAAILTRVRRSPDHPDAARLLAHVCVTVGWGSETENPPPHFAEAADLIVDRCAASPGIEHLCETLGNGLSGSPHWAARFEGHLRSILKVNEDRWVRCTASMALASIAQSADGRQEEAERLYEQLLADFDGQTEYVGQNVEREYRRRAAVQLEAIRFSPTGRQAPEIAGVDLDGRPMALSEYRGKVVLLSFWATWCHPCMKLIPHERELARRLQDRPFAIVGVNGDDGDVDAVQYGITWRSFRDKRPGLESISDEWTAFFPTLLLIDHKGIIRKRFTGSPPPEVLDRMVDELVEAVQVE